jgi:hypothetical protein
MCHSGRHEQVCKLFILCLTDPFFPEAAETIIQLDDGDS